MPCIGQPILSILKTVLRRLPLTAHCGPALRCAVLCRAVPRPPLCVPQEVHRTLSTLLPRLPGPAAAALSPHLEALHNTAIDIGVCAVSSALRICCAWVWVLSRLLSTLCVPACLL
jgi:hypothetical protein